jgi:hypothetical protein
MFDSGRWRGRLREISKEGLILCIKAIRQQFIHCSHSIQMGYRLALKGMLISLLIDGTKQRDKNFYVVIAHSAEKLQLVNLLNLESRDDPTIAKHVASIIQELIAHSIHVNCIVIDNDSDIVRSLDTDENTETVQILSGEKLLHGRCGCQSANLALDDLGREEANFLSLRDEKMPMLQILRRKKMTDQELLAKTGCDFENPCHSKYEVEHVHPGLRFSLEAPRDNSDCVGGGAAQTNTLRTLAASRGHDP